MVFSRWSFSEIKIEIHLINQLIYNDTLDDDYVIVLCSLPLIALVNLLTNGDGAIIS